MTDRQTDRPTDARGKTICLPTLAGGRHNNGVRSNSVTPAVAGVEQEWAILRCMSVGTVDVRL